MTDRDHARAPGLVRLLALLAAACGGTPYVADVDATAIVRQNAADAFVAFFDPARDAAAFRTFGARIARAQDRDGLLAGWRAVPRLLAAGQDFLEQHVFAPARAEHRWPAAAPAPALEAAFAAGTRAGVQDFLQRR